MNVNGMRLLLLLSTCCFLETFSFDHVATYLEYNNHLMQGFVQSEDEQGIQECLERQDILNNPRRNVRRLSQVVEDLHFIHNALHNTYAQRVSEEKR